MEKQIDYNDFRLFSMERAERQIGNPIDISDKFIWLWISFNAMLKQHYGEDETDFNLLFGKSRTKIKLGKLKKNLRIEDSKEKSNVYSSCEGITNNNEMINILKKLKEDREFDTKLKALEEKGTIPDMRYPNFDNGCPEETHKDEKEEKELESLIRKIYQVRCGLIHGRMDISKEENEETIKIVHFILKKMVDNLAISWRLLSKLK